MHIECCCLAVYKYVYTCEHTFEYMGAEKQTAKKSDFASSFLLSHTTKAVIELFHTQNDIAFAIVAPFSPFVCKLARVGVLANYSSAKFQHDAILSNKQVEVHMCDYCACGVLLLSAHDH